MSAQNTGQPLLTLVLSLLLVILIGFLLLIGQSLLVPILTAMIAVYVLVRAADGLGRLPVIGRLPEWVRRLLVMAGFVVIGLVLMNIVVATGERVVAAIPRYQANLEVLLARTADQLHLDELASWQNLNRLLVQNIDMQSLLTNVLGSAGSLLSVVILVGVYMIFLLSERSSFARKLAVAMPGRNSVRTQRIIKAVNRRIGNYLALKTLLNILIGSISWLVMWSLDVDFALFWALLIGLMNYIPYVGAFIGIAFPVLLTLAQFGSLQTTLFLASLLSAAQFYVGSVLEPRVIGRQVNLSPFVVLVALSLWYGLWGVSGAILAIPLTSMLTIILASFPGTRPMAVLLADNVEAYARGIDAMAEHDLDRP